MKIGILGSGAVAQTLGNGFIKHGYAVKLGTRDKSKLAEWKSKAGTKASVGSFEEAAHFGDLLVIAVKGDAAEAVLVAAGLENLKDKTIIDTTNPIANTPPVNGVLSFFTGPNDSLMERLQKAAPEANFVKAFNSVGNPKMVNPKYKDGKPTMFICGNNAEAKKTTTKLLEELSWEALDMGTVEAARAIEPLCTLWCILGFKNNEWTHAFKLLRH